MILTSIFYCSKKFDNTSLIAGPSCLYRQEEIISIFKETNTPVYSEHITEIPATLPVERMCLRVLVALMEVLVLYFTYIKGRQY